MIEPPDTVDRVVTFPRRPFSARFIRVPMWKREALKPPPDKDREISSLIV